MDARRKAIFKNRDLAKDAARRKYEDVLHRCNAEMAEARRTYDVEVAAADREWSAALDAAKEAAQAHA